MKAVRFPHTIRSGSITVTIYQSIRPATERQKERKVFTLVWHLGGRRHVKQFANLAKAMEEGRLKAEQMASGRVELASAMTMVEADLLTAAKKAAGAVPLLTALEEWQKGRKLCQGSFIQACELWAETQVVKVESVTAEEAAKRFLAAKRVAGVDISAGLERTLPKFLMQFGTRELSAISSTALQAWLDEMAHPSTRNSHRKRLMTFFRWARKKGMLPSAALTEIEKTDRAKEGNLDIGILTLAQYSDVLQLIRSKYPKYLAAAVLAGFCGLRRKEIHQQLWKDVLLDRGHIRVTAAKANTPAKRLIPLCAAAVEWLMLCKRSKLLISPPWGMDMIRSYCREADPPIPCPENAFRHSFISYRVAATGDLAATSMEAGNSVRIIHSHYRELVTKDDGLAWFAIRPDKKGGKRSKVMKFKEAVA